MYPKSYLNSREPTIRTPAQMRAVLDARAPGVFEAAGGDRNVRPVPQEGRSPLPDSPPLVWLDPVTCPDGTGHQMTLDGRYVVCKAFVGGVAAYTASFGLSSPRAPLGSYATVLEAQTKVREHRRDRPR